MEETPSPPLTEVVSSTDSASLESDHDMSMKDNCKTRMRERKAAHGAQAILKIPMDFSSNLAKGFHNAPKLYGDHTVRRAETITGVKSGMMAAGKYLAFGRDDGVTGLVTHPVRDAKEHGVAGLLLGVVKGVGGLVLKPTAGKTFQMPSLSK